MAETVRVDTLATLVEGYQHTDPRLYDVLKGLIDSLSGIQAIVDPLEQAISASAAVSAALPSVVTGFSYEILNGKILRLYWSLASNAATYEIRRGTVWDTATFVVSTNQLEVRLDPIATGSYTYLIRALNGNGDYSASTSLSVLISPISASTVTATVIDNNVLLKWSEPISPWDIDYYEVQKDGVVVGYIDSSFFVIFETIAGTYTYSIIAVDIAGNRGPINSVSATVSQPKDFELEDLRISLLSGTKVNAIVYGDVFLGWFSDDTVGWVQDDTDGWIADNTGKLLVCIDDTEVFSDHFTTRIWTSPADQITAGYPVYIQPTNLTASYQETIDYGAIFTNVILNLSWTLEQLSLGGTVSVTSSIEFSLDGIAWDAPVSGPSAFKDSFRYARITVSFSASNDKAVAVFSSFQIQLDVKRDIDSGVVVASAADVNGTQVLFNKAFKDIDSITLAPTKAVEPLSAIYEFVDVPNPTEFFVYVFDSAGNRVSAIVSWKARGII